MSHVAKVELKIKDLAALAACAGSLGLEFIKDKTTYKWWGRSVGDYPLPEGFKASDLGKCDHVLRVKGSGPDAWEIGVVKAKSGDGYVLLFDFYGSRGAPLINALGFKGSAHNPDAGSVGWKLKQEYGAAVATRQYQKQGYRVTRKVDAAGRVVLSAFK